MCAVRQPERSAVVFLVQLGLSEGELAQSAPDLPASLQGLAVLRELQADRKTVRGCVALSAAPNVGKRKAPPSFNLHL